ncbi:MAG: hypothetical protein F4Y35_03840 [Chloroflexi bacterium]|nr:hypothetical protein [Chloroflexota bacterium]
MRDTLAWLRPERRRLQMEPRLIGVFGLTPPLADAPWGEWRREQEVDWRRRALRQLCWNLPLTSACAGCGRYAASAWGPSRCIGPLVL